MSSKQPAFQFYPGDWMQDTRALSLAAKGAWIDILCALWRSQNRGTLTLPLMGWARHIGASVEQTKAVIDELVDMQVCDSPDANERNGVTDHSKKVTLICRRMAREEKARISNANRQKRYRERGCNAESNADITSLSSSSSSSSHTEEGACAENPRGKPPELDRPSKASRPGDWQGFVGIWSVYPKQQGQEEAWREYCRLKDNGTLDPPGMIRDKVIELKTNDSQWLRGIGIPSLAKWLSGKRWEDQPFTEPTATVMNEPPMPRGMTDAEYEAMMAGANA